MKAQPHIQKSVIDLAKQTGTIQTTKGRQDQLPVNFGLFHVESQQVSLLDEIQTFVSVQPSEIPTMHEPIPLYELKKSKSDFQASKIVTSKAGEEFIRQFYGDDLEVYESFFLLMLNRANKTIGYAKISQGGICGTVVDPLIVAKYVTDSLAKCVILCHNHPSGNTQPSQQDKDITVKIQNMLRYFDVQVIDHLILTANDYFSFADNVLL